MAQIILAFFVAAVAVLAITPLVRWFVTRMGILKAPNNRTIHQVPTPHMGGIGMAAGFFLAVILVEGSLKPQLLGLLIGALLMSALGFLDDLFHLRASVKLVLMLIPALVLTHFGVEIRWLTDPFGGLISTGIWAVPLTVFWIVAVVNVVNLVDGLDGLAAGVTAIAGITMLVVSIHMDENTPAIVIAALIGSAIAFLRYNFNPATIFMGDTGSLFLGFVIAGVAVMGTLKDTTTIALVVPTLALGLPIFDTAFAILRRVVNRRPIGEPDRGHLHHRLLDLGLTQKQTVLLLYFVSIMLGVVAVLGSETSMWIGLSVFAMLVVLFSLSAKRVGLLKLRARKEQSPGA